MNALALINADLTIAATVKRVEFTSDLKTGRCSLILELVDDDQFPTTLIVVKAGGISNWSVDSLGGGVTQLLCLRARDVANLQHDRTRFVLEDLENGALSLRCEMLATKREESVD